MANKEFVTVSVSADNKVWLQAQRDRIARSSDYPRKVSLDEAFTALRTAHEQRQALNDKAHEVNL